MAYAEFTFAANDQLNLHGREWTPRSGIKAIVCLVHGIGEYGGRYEPVAETLNSAGYALLAFDLRGHGQSDGKRGYSPGYEALINDLDVFLSISRNRYPYHPCFLYGHSLGGSLVIHYLLRNAPKLAGAIVTSPALKLAFEPPPWKLRVLRLLDTMNLQLAMNRGVDSNNLSREPAVVDAYNTDPLVHNRITPGLALSMLKAGTWNLEQADQLKTPLLLMHGGADAVTSADASIQFAETAGILCELKIWDGCFHELHHEPEKARVLQNILHWMDGYS